MLDLKLVFRAKNKLLQNIHTVPFNSTPAPLTFYSLLYF